ncbi:MAG: hypothetical protein FD133_1380 [Erysipelotrichaceae bacterium]|nr:MAG: hypothetical protein FD179_17 [Erysipelotrichaceae bacterium]TXT17455.1 MAG: hypothetical protein FD133_1380 [Erysipelotrichaceae bacterium]
MKEITGFDASDIEKNKVIAALAYLIFFLPLLAAPDSKFGKFHANQGFWILIAGIIVSYILRFIPLIGGLLNGVLSLGLFVLIVYLAYNAYSGKAFELPVVGNIVIFK